MARFRLAYPVLDQAFVSSSTFLASFAVGRFGSPQDLGLFSVAASIVVLAGVVQGGVVTRPLLVIGNTLCLEERARYLVSLAKLQGELIALSASAAALGLLVWSGLANQTRGPFTLAVVLLLVSFQAREFLRFCLLSEERLDSAARSSALYFVSLLTIIAFLALRPGTRISATEMVAAVTFAGLTPTVWASVRGLGFPPIRARAPVRDAVSRNLDYSKWELFGSVCNFGYVGLVPILLASQGALAEAGGFAAARTLVGGLQMIVFGTYNFMVPHATALAQEGRSASLRFLRRSAVALAALMLFAVLSLCLFAGVVLSAVYGPEFQRFASPLRIFGAYCLVASLTATVHAFILSQRYPRAKGISQFAGMIAGMSVIVVCYNQLTATAGAVACLTGEVVTLLTGAAFAWRPKQAGHRD